jgi:hypothetical protein
MPAVVQFWAYYCYYCGLPGPLLTKEPPRDPRQLVNRDDRRKYEGWRLSFTGRNAICAKHSNHSWHH